MKTILIIRTGMSDTWQEKVAGITAYARTEDWQLQFIDARMRKPNFKNLISFWKPDGIIVDASGSLPLSFGSPFPKIPLVIIHPRDPECLARFSCVISDPQAIATLAAKELLGRNLCSIAFVDWHERVTWSASKRESFRKIVEMNGHELQVVIPGALNKSDPTEFENKLCSAIAELPRPCGIFAIFDAFGARCISTITRLGFSIPQDFSVISVDDDISVCESCIPTLSSIRPDYFRIGFSACCQLSEQIRKTRVPIRTIRVPPLRLTRRASTRLVGSGDSAIARALEFIRQHACDGLTPDKVMPLFGSCSIRSAEMRFKAATGKSIDATILDARLSCACDYLAAKNSSIQTIANFCGWKSDIAFRKAFRSRFGMSPRDWINCNPTQRRQTSV